MRRSLRDRTLAMGVRLTVRPLLSLPLPWTAHRRLMQVGALFRPRVPGLHVTREAIGGVPCRVSEPKEGAAGELIWFHGGGFVMGSPDTYHRLLDELARRSGRRVIAPDYRLAPEHPFPAAHDDCLAVARARPGAALGGDSAGGCLALGVAARLCREAPPERLVLASPAADLDPTRPAPEGHDEIVLAVPMLKRAVTDYVGDADPRDPRVSPIHADWPCPIPALIFVAEGEILQRDAEAVAERLRGAGAEVRLRIFRDVFHAWLLAVGSGAPGAERAVDEAAEFLRVHP
ncbi:alpha/beta hydrolase [Jannaschia sp. Os4]|uniref:alpha/beta hydrolase n=1 Tax=Jannaschia sp. Os4 TaxID=2807617 RepID=UPI00193ACAB9|nr:alpha/beta hydrolase [Jannaschia sp. Os4]MBM2577692.1 alpha/beta hydrolase [Jannaschia sp. Os4]